MTFSTPDQMTYFDARPNENDFNSSPVQMTLLDGRPNDIFRRPTKLQIFIPVQMIYFDARPNDLFSTERNQASKPKYCEHARSNEIF